MTESLRVLELYSGIGGLHFALKVSGIPAQVVAAADINTTVNYIYKHNFPETPLLQRNIESLTVLEIDKLQPDLIWMSPPCQPFTRNGLKKDCSDERSISFLHILQIVSRLSKKPKYILLENVKGFEISEARNCLIETLKKADYNFQEFLLTPSQFGIPNSRLRYYILAKLKPLQFRFETKETVMEECPDIIGKSHYLFNDITSGNKCVVLEQYLEKQPKDYFKKYLVPPDILDRYAMILDIVEKNDCRSCCFTKGYFHYVKGTGSVVKTNSDLELASVYKEVAELPVGHERRIDLLKSLCLRYFTPKEVANIMGFPDEFKFPEDLSDRQCYRVLGNSLSIHIIVILLQLIIA